MHNQFTITIHDEHGIKQFNIHQIVKKFGLYILGFVLFCFALAAFSITYLNVSVNKIEDKKNKIKEAYTVLQEKNTGLQSTVNLTELPLNKNVMNLLQ